MVIVIPGSIKLRLVDRIGIDDGQVGRVLTLWQITTLVLTLGIGPILDRLGHRGVLACGFVLVATALWRFAVAERLSGVFAAAALLGAGGSCLNTAGNTLLPLLNPSNPASASNLGNVFFGLGAFVVPFVIAYLFERLRYTRAIAVLATIPALALIPALTAHYPPVSAGVHQAATLSMLESPAVILAGCMLFCMVGLEVSTASWTTTYLRKLGFREQRAVLLFSMLWVAKIAGRLIASQVVTTGTAKNAIQLMSLATAACFVVLAVTKSRNVAAATVPCLGLFFGPIFPTTIGVVFARTSPALYGTVFSMVYACGLAGSSSVPYIVGHLSKTRSIQTGYRLLGGLGLFLFVLASLL
jgi:fucose permease